MNEDLMERSDDPKVWAKAVLGTLREREGREEAEVLLRGLLENTDPFELERAEHELADEGIGPDDLKLLCDAHSRAIAEAGEGRDTFPELPGHPIHTLMEEHVHILRFAEMVREAARSIREGEENADDPAILSEFGPFMAEARKHFQKEEDVLFPLLERHRIMRAPASLWSDHDVLRSKEKEVRALLARRGSLDPRAFASSFECRAAQLLSLLHAHFRREDREIFPLAIRSLDAREWNEARERFDETGICSFIPRHGTIGFTSSEVPTSSKGDMFIMPDGNLTAEELELILDRLPVDLTFVDREDRVRYINNAPDRVFPRPPSVLGKKVQDCHPQKSVQVVQGIIDDFKAGRKDHAEFWIDLRGRFVNIRYLALRDRKGDYRGVLEITQDGTHLRELKGEKRLLDEPRQ